MSRDPQPTGVVRRKAWVALMVRDIDDRRATDGDWFLHELVRAAWPSPLARVQ